MHVMTYNVSRRCTVPPCPNQGTARDRVGLNGATSHLLVEL